MKSKISVLLILCFVTLFSALNAANGPVDIIIVIDTSKSIRKNLTAVKRYIKNTLFRRVISENDSIYVFTFDETFHFKKSITGKNNPSAIDSTLNKLKATGEYTDLTNAVNEMTGYLSKHTKNRRKIIFFLTDGLNDPPPWSKYTRRVAA
jgi:uncharacterized protein with von Willebrand factor type A (vWA) domain